MARKLPTLPKEYLGKLYEEGPEKIASAIRVELDSFIEKIVNSKSRHLYLVGRKSRHLFHPLISSRLIEKGISINFLNILTGEIRNSPILETWGLAATPRKIALLADSVNEGDEKAKIIQIMNEHDYEVEKLFCYVANTSGIESLKSEKIIKSENIVSLKTLPPDQYIEFNKRLETYFQSRIEPMDTDHVIQNFSVANKIEETEFSDQFKKSINKSLPCEGEFEKAARVSDKDVPENVLFAPTNIVNNNFRCYDHNKCMKQNKSEIQRILGNLKVEYLLVRAKAELGETESSFCVMVTCPPSEEGINYNSVIKEKKCLSAVGKCMLEHVLYDPKFKKEEIAKIVCPRCIENHISSPILNKIAKRLKRSVEMKSYL